MEREPEQDLEELQEQTDQLGEQIEEAREDWQAKKDDDKVPGALGDVTEMDADDAPETDYPSKA
jgi:hypothetical protein